jgi:hypothetical protein
VDGRSLLEVRVRRRDRRKQSDRRVQEDEELRRGADQRPDADEVGSPVAVEVADLRLSHGADDAAGRTGRDDERPPARVVDDEDRLDQRSAARAREQRVEVAVLIEIAQESPPRRRRGPRVLRRRRRDESGSADVQPEETRPRREGMPGHDARREEQVGGAVAVDVARVARGHGMDPRRDRGKPRQVREHETALVHGDADPRPPVDEHEVVEAVSVDVDRHRGGVRDRRPQRRCGRRDEGTGPVVDEDGRSREDVDVPVAVEVAERLGGRRRPTARRGTLEGLARRSRRPKAART